MQTWSPKGNYSNCISVLYCSATSALSNLVYLFYDYDYYYYHYHYHHYHYHYHYYYSYSYSYYFFWVAGLLFRPPGLFAREGGALLIRIEHDIYI